MKWPNIQSRSPIGVDIGARAIKAAQVHGSEVIAAASVPRTQLEGGLLDPVEVRRLRDEIRGGAFRGHTVVLSVPTSRLMTGVLELPPRGSGAPIEQLARTELARRHGVEPQSIEMACWDLPAPARAGNRTYVMAVAGALAQLDKLVDTFEAEGFNVRALDVHATAVSRACRGLIAETGGTAAILDLGWSSSQLVLLHQGVTVYERNLLQCGIGAMVRHLATQLDVHESVAEGMLREEGVCCLETAGKAAASVLRDSPCTHLESMVSEMRIPLSYLVSQYPDTQLKRLLLIGGGACVKGMQAFLSKRLDLEVRAVQPGDLGTCPEAIQSRHSSSLVTAVGLAEYAEKES